MHKRNVVVVVANSGRARILRRDHETGHLITHLDLEDGPAVRPINPHGSTLDERIQRRRVIAFIEVIVAHLGEMTKAHEVEGVVIAAPQRMLPDLKARAAQATPVLGSVQKDLVKMADHDMTAALQAEILKAEGAAAR